MFSDVLALLEFGRFTDLLLPGWIDRTGPVPVHRPYTFDACLQAETGLIQFTSVHNNGGLHIRVVDKVELGPDLEDEIVMGSVGAHFLSASHPLHCTGLRLFTDNESVPGNAIFRAAEITFGHHTVFFDPMWVDGIRLSTGPAPREWLTEERSARRQELFGLLKETIWWPARLLPPGSPK